MVELLLDRAVYGMAEVDRLLRLPAGTARRWIDGYERGGRVYPPVIRGEPTGDELVTWGEFVETRLLAAYRDKGVPLVRMRPAIQRLRAELGVEHPLAWAKPYVGGRDLVARVQDETGLERRFFLVELRTGQLVLGAQAEQFVSSVEFTDPTDGYVERIRPLGRHSSVVIDPLRSFGDPAVRSVPTSVIAEEFRAGDAPESIAAGFELELRDVYDALRFEMGTEALAA
ncbi:MAG: DUF433 domain-containing protein [Egibacteraceae bacterium]